MDKNKITNKKIVKIQKDIEYTYNYKVNTQKGETMSTNKTVSTGIRGLDKVIENLQLGDNIVWQINSIAEYKQIVKPFVEKAKKDNHRVVYIRFGEHEPVIENIEKIRVYELDKSLGFEEFATTVNSIISIEGEETFYIFDCLTDLQKSWYSDLMTANFFKVTCPYLHKLNTVAYFSVSRNSHTVETISIIRRITQIFIEMYGLNDEVYVHPIKVSGRYSPTMFIPHRIKGNEVENITSSVDTAALFSHFDWNNERLGYWRRTFNKAKSSLHKDEKTREEMKELLIKMLVGEKSKIYDMCLKYFELEDVVQIASREVGAGLIGGKSIGMLLATRILTKIDEGEEYFKSLIEPHDSFYIGADVFYYYIVDNDMWQTRIKQKTEEGYFEYGEELRQKLESGKFSQHIKDQFMHVIEYYGQSPIIVRSSSLLEDSFGNAFAGKYESVFCVNKGTPEERLEAFEEAVKKVYASTMNEEALNYRKIRGLDKRDEQMAILVQRVSGDYHGEYFYPHLAGVGNSSNLYVWNNKVDMDAGMLRLVYGLGTRAVDRVNHDYARIVTLDNPMRIPNLTEEDPTKYTQHYVDVLNIEDNKIKTVYVNEAMKKGVKANKNLFGEKDKETEEILKRIGRNPSNAPFILNFERVLRNTKFAQAMKKVLEVLSIEYDHPVDIEFTANFDKEGNFRFNLLQCRPLQTRGLGKTVELPKFTDKNECLFSSKGNFMGGNVRLPIDYVVYVDAHEYVKLSEDDKYFCARHIGMINKNMKDKNAMLMGPGRWGSKSPSLGVPVRFTELSNMSVMCEIAYNEEGMTPELSYGSHFFQDLVETGIFYVGLFDNEEDMVFNKDKLTNHENLVKEFIVSDKVNTDVIKVYSTKGLQIYSDIGSQIVTCS